MVTDLKVLNGLTSAKPSSRDVAEGELVTGAKRAAKDSGTQAECRAFEPTVVQGGATVHVSMQFQVPAERLRLIVFKFIQDFAVVAIHVGHRSQFDGPEIPAAMFAETMVVPAVRIKDMVAPMVNFSVTVRNTCASARVFTAAVLYDEVTRR